MVIGVLVDVNDDVPLDMLAGGTKERHVGVHSRVSPSVMGSELD